MATAGGRWWAAKRLVTGDDLRAFHRLVRRVPIAEPILRYAVHLVRHRVDDVNLRGSNLELALRGVHGDAMAAAGDDHRRYPAGKQLCGAVLGGTPGPDPLQVLIGGPVEIADTQPALVEAIPPVSILDDGGPDVRVHRDEAVVTLGKRGQDVGGAPAEHAERAPVHYVRARPERGQIGRPECGVGGVASFEPERRVRREADDGSRRGFGTSFGCSHVDLVALQVLPDELAAGVGRHPADKRARRTQSSCRDGGIHRSAAGH